MLRFRGKRKPIDVVKQLDAFPKVPQTYTQSSPVGGILSLISVLVILWLVKSEIVYFLDSRLEFKFEPDTQMNNKLSINIDITVAMNCRSIGADVVDSTGQGFGSFGQLMYEDAWFDLTKSQREHFDGMRFINEYLREEAHALQHVLWKSSFSRQYGDLPERKDSEKPNSRHDACRIHGTLELTKVAGNLHVAAGQVLPLPNGHVHVSAIRPDQTLNFSHRISQLSFGPPGPNIVQPLEGEEKIATDEDMLYQYFITVVPTDVYVRGSWVYTYQYSVRESERPISHAKGSHGVPGVFFKYDTNALRVRIVEQRDSFPTLLVRLCAVAGGVFATTAVLNQKLQALVAAVSARFSSSSSAQPMTTSEPPLLLRDPSLNNPLLGSTNLSGYTILEDPDLGIPS